MSKRQLQDGISREKHRSRTNDNGHGDNAIRFADDSAEYASMYLHFLSISRLEARAQNWKMAKSGMMKTVMDEKPTVRAEKHKTGEPAVFRTARCSLYYDPVTNPLGTPPSHKPPAFRHPCGVIRSYPPTEVTVLSSSGRSSSEESEEDESSAVAKQPAVTEPTVVQPPKLVPVNRPPPPRPVSAAGQRPLLPKLVPSQAHATGIVAELVFEKESKKLAHPLSSALLPIKPKPSQKNLVAKTPEMAANEMVLQSEPAAPVSATSLFIPTSVKKRIS